MSHPPVRTTHYTSPALPPRPDYRTLANLRTHLPDAPVLALTATATARVRDDIAASLRLQNPHVSAGSFDRPNLFYEVRFSAAAAEVVAEVKGAPLSPAARLGCAAPSPPAARLSPALRAASSGGSTIVYCLARADVDLLAEALRAAGVRGVESYHSTSAGRSEAQAAFASDASQVMVATGACGARAPSAAAPAPRDFSPPTPPQPLAGPSRRSRVRHGDRQEGRPQGHPLRGESPAPPALPPGAIAQRADCFPVDCRGDWLRRVGNRGYSIAGAQEPGVLLPGERPRGPRRDQEQARGAAPSLAQGRSRLAAPD